MQIKLLLDDREVLVGDRQCSGAVLCACEAFL